MPARPSVTQSSRVKASLAPASSGTVQLCSLGMRYWAQKAVCRRCRHAPLPRGRRWAGASAADELCDRIVLALIALCVM